MSKIFKTSVLLTFFFGINKVIALLRQWLIVNQFGLSADIDAFNVANNLPDMIFSLFSGGALALAFIPVYVEYIEEFGKKESWKLFSKTANFLFLITLALCVIAYIFAKPLVGSEFGISPGFTDSQKDLVVSLMRINLVSILIFSISGLIMASLQSHKHFLLPAIAPVLYNFGLIFGILVLSPSSGIFGLAYGTIIGSILHLLIQVPGLIKHEFKWYPLLDLRESGINKVIKLMIPRIATILLIQITFLARDNFASRLVEGSVSALTYGYFIMQVPETLIGTAIATAILPSLSQSLSQKKLLDFEDLINSSIKVMIAIGVGVSVILAMSLRPLIDLVFSFSELQVNLIVWSTWAFLFGLTAQCLLEILARVYYAKQNAKLPLVATGIRVFFFIFISVLTFRQFGVAAVAFADSVTIFLEVVILLYFMHPLKEIFAKFGSTIARSLVGGVVSGTLLIFLNQILPFSVIINLMLVLLISSVTYIVFVRKELNLLFKI